MKFTLGTSGKDVKNYTRNECNFSGFKSPDASKMDFLSYSKYIEERLPAEAPQMFGLHPNAEIR
jgi:hypothetical protein